jgi:hypothetical protein
MTTTRRILLAVAAVSACSLGATAATASADTYCVSDAACVSAGGTGGFAGLQPALDQAKAHVGPDVVKVGAGTFSAGPYAYTDGSGANPVQLQGAGAGSTTLTMPAVSGKTVLYLRSNSTVSDLGIVIPYSSDIGIDMPDVGTARRVKVVSSDPQYLGIVGIHLYGGTVDHSTVDLPLGSSAAIDTDGPNSITLTDDTLNAVYGARVLGSATPSKIQRVRMHAKYGVTAYCGHVDVEDSFIDVQGGSSGIAAMSTPNICGNATALSVRQSTFVANPGTGTSGVYAASGPGQTAAAEVTDTILSGFEKPIDLLAWGGDTFMATDYAAYDLSAVKQVVGNGGQGPLWQTHHLSADPGFANAAAGDYHLGQGSALIDAGSPSGLLAGESATDLDGAARIVDGDGANGARRDLGAFEAGPPAPAPAPTPTTTTSTTTTPATTAASTATTGQTTTVPAPRLSLTGAKRQKAYKSKRILVTAVTNQSVRLRARGTIRIGRKSLALRAITARATATKTGTRLTLKVRRTAAIRAALAHHRRVTATITVVATNAAGKTTTAIRRVTITG